jgi:DHA1 family arabinose polymer transporter-like MFS transporter
MTDIGHFSKNTVPLILVIAGLGMVIGNILGGRLADLVAPVKACLILLVSMALALITIYFVSGNQSLSLIMTFITGSLSMAIGSPIQILMIRTAKGAEMLGAAATQAAFNTGNALGAFLGGIPIVMGYGFASPELVGVLMALTGALFAVALLKRQKTERKSKAVINNHSGHE